MKNCESNESLSAEKAVVERLLKIIDTEVTEKDEEKCIEYMNALSKISVYKILYIVFIIREKQEK